MKGLKIKGPQWARAEYIQVSVDLSGREAVVSVGMRGNVENPSVVVPTVEDAMIEALKLKKQVGLPLRVSQNVLEALESPE